MAALDYGAILKINGNIKNLNKSLYMDMKESVGFTIGSIPYKYKWNGQVFDAEYRIEGCYFTYFGDEELLFASYKNLLIAVVNKTTVIPMRFEYEERNKKVKYYEINNIIVKIKKIDEGKLHAKIQYKGNNFNLVYGYGIDNNYNTFKAISRKKSYGYDKHNTRYIEQFLKGLK